MSWHAGKSLLTCIQLSQYIIKYYNKKAYILSAWPNRSRISLSSPFQESRNTEQSTPKVKASKTITKPDHCVIIYDRSNNRLEVKFMNRCRRIGHIRVLSGY